MTFTFSLLSFHPFILSLLGFGLLLQIFGSAKGLKDVKLEGPKYTRFGEDIGLRCTYDLEGETLYVIKWYKGNQEFFRFLPQEKGRPKQVFPLDGINVDYFKSDENHVILRNATFETSGKYKCTVSVEGSFQTISDEKEIKIVVIGYDAPALILRDLHYEPEPGSPGEATCKIFRTYPPVNVTWFINDKKVTSRVITRTVIAEDDVKISSTISVIYFNLPYNYTGPTDIKCKMQLYDVYEDAAKIRINPRVRKNVWMSKSELQNVSKGTRISGLGLIIILVWMIQSLVL